MTFTARTWVVDPHDLPPQTPAIRKQEVFFPLFFKLSDDPFLVFWEDAVDHNSKRRGRRRKKKEEAFHKLSTCKSCYLILQKAHKWVLWFFLKEKKAFVELPLQNINLLKCSKQMVLCDAHNGSTFLSLVSSCLGSGGVTVPVFGSLNPSCIRFTDLPFCYAIYSLFIIDILAISTSPQGDCRIFQRKGALC